MENKLSLYNITNSFITLFEKAENGELTEEEIQEQGNDLALALKNKSTSIIGYVRNSELMSEAIKNEIDRLTAMKKAVDNRIDKFKEYVKENMQHLEVEKIETELGTLSIGKNPASVEIYDETLIADEYKKEKVTVSIDKTAIKNAIKNGKNVQGARLIEDKTSLRIK
jgi:hypothetical protein